jgi:hypothetical protein
MNFLIAIEDFIPSQRSNLLQFSGKAFNLRLDLLRER